MGGVLEYTELAYNCNAMQCSVYTARMALKFGFPHRKLPIFHLFGFHSISQPGFLSIFLLLEPRRGELEGRKEGAAAAKTAATAADLSLGVLLGSYHF